MLKNRTAVITLSNGDGLSGKAIPKIREGVETSTTWSASYISSTAGQLWKVQSVAEGDVLMEVHHPAQVSVMETRPLEVGPAPGRIKKMKGLCMCEPENYYFTRIESICLTPVTLGPQTESL